MSDDGHNIRTTANPPGEVQLSLTHPRGGGQMPAVRLRVEEVMSDQLLVEVELTAEQFTALLGTEVINVSGATIAPKPERIGKRMQNTATLFRRGDAADLDAEAELVRHAYLDDGWHTARIDRTNFGCRVVAYRWIDEREDTP